MFYQTYFLQLNELLVSGMKKKLGVTDFVSEIKRVENLSDLKKEARANQNDLQENIKDR